MIIPNGWHEIMDMYATINQGDWLLRGNKPWSQGSYAQASVGGCRATWGGGLIDDCRLFRKGTPKPMLNAHYAEPLPLP
jgi:hypothetical protein